MTILTAVAEWSLLAFGILLLLLQLLAHEVGIGSAINNGANRQADRRALRSWWAVYSVFSPLCWH